MQEKIKKKLKSEFIIIAMFIALAIVLYINPETFSLSAFNLLGLISILFGIFNIYNLIIKKEKYDNNIKKAIVSILYGIVVIYKASLFVNILPLVLSFYFVLNNADKLNLLGINILKSNNKTNFIISLSITNIIISLLLVYNPFELHLSTNVFLALIMIVVESISLIINILCLLNIDTKEDCDE